MQMITNARKLQSPSRVVNTKLVKIEFILWVYHYQQSIDFIRRVNTTVMSGGITSIAYLILPEVKENLPNEDLPESGKEMELEHTSDMPNSLQMLGSNLRLPEAFSAFSIYDPEKEKAQSTQGHERNNLSQLEEDFDPVGQDTRFQTKKTVKDKKEIARLQTKNLNRFFRSKINEMLRDIKEDPQSEYDRLKADELLGRLNSSNKIMFSEMREIIQDEWLRHRLTKCSAILMRYVHRGKMGMSSKLVMLKYFNKILKAIQNPEKFTCWK